MNLAPTQLERVPFNDKRLDSFASAVEQQYGLPPRLIEAIKNAGERSQSNQQSPVGAKGVMQFMDDTRKGYPHDPRNPLESIDASGQYFRDLLQEYKGNPMAAIAHYNGGYAAGKAVLAGKEPPAKETRDYLQRVRTYLDKSQAYNAKSNEGLGDPDNPTSREEYQKLPTYSAKELIESPLTTVAGRKEWMDKMKAEFKDSTKGMTAKQLDKYWSDETFYAKNKYPKEYALYKQMDRMRSDGIPDNVMSFLDKNKPTYSLTDQGGHGTHGFVYSDKGDRAFIQNTGDWATFVHEGEHLVQQKEMKELGVKSATYGVGTIGNFNKPISELVRWTAKNSEDPAVQEIWRAGNAHNGSTEWLANVQGFAKTMQYKQWDETPFYKKLEKDFGKEKAQTMVIDMLSTLNRASYSINR